MLKPDAEICPIAISTASFSKPASRPPKRSPSSPAAASAWTSCTTRSSSSAVRSRSTRRRARARRSRSACRSRWRSRRRFWCGSAKHAMRSRCRRCRASCVSRATIWTGAWPPAIRSTAMPARNSSSTSLSQSARRARVGRVIDETQLPLLMTRTRRSARRGAHRRGGRLARNRGQVGRAADQLGAGHFRRDDHGRRLGRDDSRSCAAGAPLAALRARDAKLALPSSCRLRAAGGVAGAAPHPLIMVVDDSITMRKVTTRVLERAGAWT